MPLIGSSPYNAPACRTGDIYIFNFFRQAKSSSKRGEGGGGEPETGNVTTNQILSVLSECFSDHHLALILNVIKCINQFNYS